MAISKTSDTLAGVAALAALGEAVLNAVKDSGLAKPKRRVKRVVKAKPKAAGARKLIRPRPAIADQAEE